MEVKSISQSQVIRNSFWKFSESIGVQLIMLIITIILARILTPEDYGMMAIIVIVINFLTLFVSSSIGGYLIYAQNIRKQDFLTALLCNILVAIVLVVLLLCFAKTIASFYSAPALTLMIMVMSVTIPFCAVSSVYNSYALKFSQFKALFIRNMISGPISGALALYLAYTGAGVWALVCQQISYNVLLMFIIVFTIKIRLDGEWRVSFPSLRNMLSFGSYTLFTTIVAFISDSISDLLVGKKINASQLGIYSRGNHFPNTIFSSMNTVISNVFFPAFASYGHDMKLLKEKCRKSIRIIYSLASPLMFGLIACASPMVKVLLTERWFQSIPIIQIVCLSFLAVPFLQMTSQALLAVGSVRIRMVGEIFKMIFTFVFLFILIQYGIKGVAWSRVIVSVLMVIFTLAIMRYVMNYKVTEFLSDISKSVIASGIMTCSLFPILYLPLSDLSILSFQIPIGITVYFLSSKILGNKELFDIIGQSLQKVKQRL